MKKIALTLAILAGMTAVGTASAATPDYNYVDAGYVKVDNLSDGWGLRGGAMIGDSNFYVNAAYSRQEINHWGVHYNLSNINVGFAHPFTEATHLNAELGYENISAGGGSADGFRAGLGVRHAFNDKVEGLLRVNHYFGHDLSDDTTGTAGVTVKFDHHWGLVGEVEFGDGGETYLVGARYAF